MNNCRDESTTVMNGHFCNLMVGQNLHSVNVLSDRVLAWSNKGMRYSNILFRLG